MEMWKCWLSAFEMGSNGRVAPTRAGPQNELVVERCNGGSDERPNPEHPLQKKKKKKKTDPAH